MSRTEAPTVKTGGEMGQIIDHLVCASERRYRLQDGRDALALHFQVVNQRDAALARCIELEKRINTLELALVTATHDLRAIALNDASKEKKA